MIRHGTLFSVLTLVSLMPAASVEAQTVRRVTDAVKQGVEDRKRATEDELVMRSMMLGDSLAALGMAPVGGLADDLASGAESAVTSVVSAIGGSDDDPADELQAGLEAGRADLADVFVPGSAEPTVAGEELLGLLAALLVERGEPVLLEAYTAPSDPPDLAERRVRLARTLLAAYGADPGGLFGSSDGVPPGSPADAEVGPDLRVRPLRSRPAPD